MTLHVQPRAFSDALARVVGAVERKRTMPILGHVMMSTSGGLLTLRTTDLEVEITTTIDCQGDLAPTCAPVERLQATIARIVERGDAEFSLDGALLAIASGRSRFTMPILPPDGFPTLKMSEVGCTFDIEGKALASLFNATSIAIANDGSRPYLNGLFLFAGSIWEPTGNKLCAVATNGLKLLAREVTADLPNGFPQVIVPRKTILTLAKLVDGWDVVSVEISESRFTASFGPNRLTTKLVEGTYPDWQRVTPRVTPAMSYDSTVLANAIATAFSAVQNDKKHRGLKLMFNEGETEFNIQNMDGTATGVDACAHSLIGALPAGVLGVNPKDLLEIIGALDADTIQLGFADAASPVLLTAASLTDRKAVIMPMRV